MQSCRTKGITAQFSGGFGGERANGRIKGKITDGKEVEANKWRA
jgi:hypothetical protein